MRGSTASSTRRRASAVLTSLVAHPKGLVFGDLKQMCGLTDGNLSASSAGAAGGRAGRDREGLRPQPPANHLPHHAERAAALSRISRGARAGGARRGERREGRGRRRRACANSSQPEKFLRGNFTMQSTLDMRKTERLHVAIIMDGNGRWARAARPAAHRRPSRRHRGGAPRRRGRARSRRRRRSRCSPSRPTTGGARRWKSKC